MRRIIKTTEPDFWTDYCRKNPKIRYDDLRDTERGKEVCSRMRAYLTKEQMGICCYCCKAISEEHSHIEHIIPRARHPHKESMDYNNLVVSCTPKPGEDDTCGHKKGNNPLPVSPLDVDCESHFKFTFEGEIKGTTKAGSCTVELLNINTYKLKGARKALYDECVTMAELCGKAYVYDEYIRPNNGRLHAYVDMLQYFYDLGLFD